MAGEQSVFTTDIQIIRDYVTLRDEALYALMQTARPVAEPSLMAAQLHFHAATPAPAPTSVAISALPRFRATTCTRISMPGPTKRPLQPPTTAAPQPVAAPVAPPEDSIYVLAFICKRVPLCPNPDGSLQW
jgi:hypothetical protein